MVATSHKAPTPVLASPNVVGLKASPSGGISRDTLGEIKAMTTDSDVTLWPGSLGHDSESTQTLEKILSDTDSPTVLCGDALDSAIGFGGLGERDQTYIVITVSQLRALQTGLHGEQAVVSGMQLTNLVKVLSEMTLAHKFGLVTLHEDILVVATGGQITSTALDLPKDKEEIRWRVELAAAAAVLLAQFPNKPLDALTSAAWLYKVAHHA
jgi:hypothetical protein